ncbi:phage head closure protein [Rummeliibacillus stabekisii]|uniref:phage head closure protein n=1 Tax=Rummeliibacillus stabekisii TaxID=241244 RepID=UPI00371DEC30
MPKLTRTGRLNQRISFIKTIKKKNEYGEAITEKVPVHLCWCDVRSQFLNEVKSSIGTILEDTVTFVIRYTQAVNIKNDMLIQYKNCEYEIVKITLDESFKEFSTIIAKKVS